MPHFHLLQENDLLQMERTVLTSLEFRMMPTAYTFCSVYRMAYTMHSPSASLASYLMVRTQILAHADIQVLQKPCMLNLFYNVSVLMILNPLSRCRNWHNWNIHSCNIIPACWRRLHWWWQKPTLARRERQPIWSSIFSPSLVIQSIV